MRKVSDRTFLLHLGGKIEVASKVPLKTRDDLSMAYTPGVARVCLALAEHPEDVRRLTIKGNTVAVVTDGSAVLGLGDIGPGASLPVMEGKAALFKRFADIDAWPICLDTQDVDEIVRTVELIAPGFGGINLEDIAAPAVLRDRGAAAREARHPGLPRRPARDGDRRPRRAAQRAAGGGQAAGRRAGGRRRWRRGRDGDRLAAAGGRRAARAGVGPRGHPGPGRRPAVPGQARPGAAHQPRVPARRAARRPGRCGRLHRGERGQRAAGRGARRDGREGDRVPDGQPDAGGRPGPRPAALRRGRLGPLGPAEPDQQRAGLPRRLPRAARRQGHGDHAPGCCWPPPTRWPPSSGTTSSTPTTSSPASSTRPPPRPSPPRSPTRPGTSRARRRRSAASRPPPPELASPAPGKGSNAYV